MGEAASAVPSPPVTVWKPGPLIFQVTFSPTFTVISAGSNVFSGVTSTVPGSVAAFVGSADAVASPVAPSVAVGFAVGFAEKTVGCTDLSGTGFAVSGLAFARVVSP